MVLLNTQEVHLIEALRARGGKWVPEKGQYTVVPEMLKVLELADAQILMGLLVGMRERQLVAFPLSRRVRRGETRLAAAVSKRENPDPAEWDVESVSLLYAGVRMYERHMSGAVPAQPDAVLKVRKESDPFPKGAKPPTSGKPPGRKGRPPKQSPAGAPSGPKPPDATTPAVRPSAAPLALSVPVTAPYELVVLDLLRVRPVSFADDAASTALQWLELAGRDLPDDRQVALAEMRVTLSELEDAGEVRVDRRPNLTLRGLHLRTPGRRRLEAYAPERDTPE